jgi:hypothetical protein
MAGGEAVSSGDCRNRNLLEPVEMPMDVNEVVAAVRVTIVGSKGGFASDPPATPAVPTAMSTSILEKRPPEKIPAFTKAGSRVKITAHTRPWNLVELAAKVALPCCLGTLFTAVNTMNGTYRAWPRVERSLCIALVTATQNLLIERKGSSHTAEVPIMMSTLFSGIYMMISRRTRPKWGQKPARQQSFHELTTPQSKHSWPREVSLPRSKMSGAFSNAAMLRGW